MSNTLIRQARLVKLVLDDGAPRAIRASERLVLFTLADDARDHLGGRSHLGPAEIMDRTGCSRRMVRYALKYLADSGHITREDGAVGDVSPTLVHPQIKILSGADIAPVQCNPLHPSGATHCTTPLREEDLIPITHTPQASARETFSGDQEKQKEAAGLGQAEAPVPEPTTPAPAAPDPVSAVFDAWDAMHARSGLPGGPVVRDMARRVAIDLKLRDGDLPQLLAVIAKVGETVRAGGMRKKAAPGQSDIFATFDAVFEIGHAAGLRLFTRLLDGQEWGVIGARPEPTPLPPKGQAMPDEPPEIARLRQLLHDKLGGRTYANWIEALRFEKDPAGALRVFAKTPFMVDRVRSDFGHQIGIFARTIWPSCDEVLFGLARTEERV